MARIIGNNPPFTGTRDGITIYRMRDEHLYYLRMKSSLTGKRVKKDPAFKGLMRHAKIMAISSPLASSVYKQLAEEKQDVKLYRQMTGMAQRMLKEGYKEEEVKKALEQKYLPKLVVPAHKHIHNRYRLYHPEKVSAPQLYSYRSYSLWTG